MARVDAQQSSSNQADTIGGKALEDILAAAPVPQLSLHKRPSWGCSEVRQFLSCCVPDTGLALAELDPGVVPKSIGEGPIRGWRRAAAQVEHTM